VQQGAGEPVPYLQELLDDLRPVRSEIRKVPYEFQVGADEMLVLNR
jgi:hypothetical protein